MLVSSSSPSSSWLPLSVFFVLCSWHLDLGSPLWPKSKLTPSCGWLLLRIRSGLRAGMGRRSALCCGAGGQSRAADTFSPQWLWVLVQAARSIRASLGGEQNGVGRSIHRGLGAVAGCRAQCIGVLGAAVAILAPYSGHVSRIPPNQAQIYRNRRSMQATFSRNRTECGQHW